jgi:hypothetical protein
MFENTVLTFLHTATGTETKQVLSHTGTVVVSTCQLAYNWPLKFVPVADWLAHLPT